MNSWERFDDLFDVTHILTWQPRCNLDHGLAFQHGHGMSFNSYQHDSDLAELHSTLAFGAPLRKNIFNLTHSLTQLWTLFSETSSASFDKYFTVQEGGFDASGCGWCSYAQGPCTVWNTCMTRSVEFAGILHLLTRKPQLWTYAKFRHSSNSASPSGSSTQVTPGKVGEIYLVQIIFLLETWTFRRTRPVCSNILCIPLLLFYSSTGKTRIQVAAFLSTSCLAEDPIIVCIDFRKVSLTPTLSNTLQHSPTLLYPMDPIVVFKRLPALTIDKGQFQSFKPSPSWDILMPHSGSMFWGLHVWISGRFMFDIKGNQYHSVTWIQLSRTYRSK